MKKLLLFLVLAGSLNLVSCKNETKPSGEEEQKDTLKEKVLDKAKVGKASKEYDDFVNDSTTTDTATKNK